MRIGQYVITQNNLEDYRTSDNTFTVGLGQATHIGIQAYPGFTFTINNSGWDITIGKTGIYELDLLGLGVVNSITFSVFQPTLSVDKLIIDYVMEVG